MRTEGFGGLRGCVAGLVAFALAGCGHTTPRIVIKEVRIPVAVTCVPAIPQAPTYAADQVSLNGTVFELVQALLIDREQRKARELELHAVVEGCR